MLPAIEALVQTEAIHPISASADRADPSVSVLSVPSPAFYSLVTMRELNEFFARRWATDDL
jgi:hypothetical protein